MNSFALTSSAFTIVCAVALASATGLAKTHARTNAGSYAVAQTGGSPAPVPAPLTPPADWVAVDTHALVISNLHVFAAWKMRLDHPDVFTPNINVGYEKFAGDLDAYDRASIASIHGTAPGARILLHEKTSICTGIPAWHTIWTADTLSNLKLHYEQFSIAGDEDKFVATYTRALSQPDIEEARLSLRTICSPVAPPN